MVSHVGAVPLDCGVGSSVGMLTSLVGTVMSLVGGGTSNIGGVESLGVSVILSKGGVVSFVFIS